MNGILGLGYNIALYGTSNAHQGYVVCLIITSFILTYLYLVPFYTAILIKVAKTFYKRNLKRK
jgi:hypothetical protein